MKPKYTPRDVKNLPQYKEKLKKIEKDRSRLTLQEIALEKKIDALEKKIREIQQISTFYEGVPLHFDTPNPEDYTHSFDIETVPSCSMRAHIYHNANAAQDVDRWGIVVYDFSQTEWNKREMSLGARFPREEVLKLGMDWVIGKGIPEKYQ